MTQDVVVTGLGAVSPLGDGVAAFETGLLAGHPNVAPVDIFDAAPYRVQTAQTVRRDLRRPGDPAAAFALRAAAEAISNAALDEDALRACGLALATTAAGWTSGQRLFNAFLQDDEAAFAPLLYRPEELFKEAVPYAIARRFGLQGPCALLSPACAAASCAIAWAAQRIRDGDADLMLAGASDALTEVVFAGFHAMRLLADDACRPFSAGRRGLVLSEGAAILVLEAESHARERSAPVLARLSGWGLSCDAAHPTTPGSDGVLRAMTGALQDAGLDAQDVDQVSAHGTGSGANDAAEAQALASLLGDRISAVPVSAIKGMTGHTEGAAGAFGALAAVLSLQHDALPPLAGFTARDAALPPLRLALDGTEHHAGRNVLVNTSGFGGANACLLLEKPSSTPCHREAPDRRAVVTATVALTAEDGTLPEPGTATFWPGGRSLPLDRISSLVLMAADCLLGRRATPGTDTEAAVVLGTTYGSQARHERMWAALADGGPRAVDANDFALSTFNAPGSAVASAYGLGGANLVFLGPTGGVAAIEEASRLIASGRARRVLAGAYEEVTPYFRGILGGVGESDPAEGVALLLLEDESKAAERDAPSLARILGHAGRTPSEAWPGGAEFAATMRSALERAAVAPEDLGAVILDPHANSREAQLAAIDALFPVGITLIDLAPIYGNCLAASTPLGLNVTLSASAAGRWPSSAVLRGDAVFASGRPVLISACGLMSGCAALVVLPHGHV
jgi:3-oxoacyl-[acyl-carrier-protein] synthase II